MRKISDKSKLGYVLQIMKKIRERLRNCYRLDDTRKTRQLNVMWYPEQDPGKRKKKRNWENPNKVCKLVNNNLLKLEFQF